MKDPYEAHRKRIARERKRAAGLVERTVWVKPEDWPRVKDLVAELNGDGN